MTAVVVPLGALVLWLMILFPWFALAVGVLIAILFVVCFIASRGV